MTLSVIPTLDITLNGNALSARQKAELIQNGNIPCLLLSGATFVDEYGNRLSINGNRMAELIDNLPSDNDFLDKLDSLSEDALILLAIESATGESYAMSRYGTVNLQQTFNESILVARKTFKGSDQQTIILGQCNPCSPVLRRRSNEFWGTFTCGMHDRSNIGRYSGYDLNNFGVAFGIEREISNRLFGGSAVHFFSPAQYLGWQELTDCPKTVNRNFITAPV